MKQSGRTPKQPVEKQDNKPPEQQSHIAWHPAFIEALKLELEEYIDLLEFHSEFQLSSEPLRIDCVVIKKAKDLVIKKNIAAIFREVNLLEYKSPDDYVSVTDFYKVYGYACLYASIEKVPITGLTVSFVESHYPRELLDHLKEIRKFKVEETSQGIYNVTGDILPIQIIDSRELSVEENIWLQGLNNNLDKNEINRVLTEVYRYGKAARIQAYLNVITQANIYTVREVIEMSNETLTLDQVFEETGMAARWIAKAEARGEVIGEARGVAIGEARGVAIGEARGVAIGEARGEAKAEARLKGKEALAIAQNMVKHGFPMETIISITQLDPEKVKELFNK